MINKRRMLVLTFSIILLCLSLIVGTTYALFTETIIVKNHLQAGSLDVSLVRTNLKYNILNEKGYFEEKEIEENVDFSSLKNESIFDIEESSFVVPGSYYEVEFELRNKGNVAIDYIINIVVNNETNELSKQINVQLIENNNVVKENTLDEIKNNNFVISKGEMIVGEETKKLTIRIEFMDDLSNNSINNNLAQNKETMFDLIVEAVQKTNK